MQCFIYFGGLLYLFRAYSNLFDSMLSNIQKNSEIEQYGTNSYRVHRKWLPKIWHRSGYRTGLLVRGRSLSLCRWLLMINYDEHSLHISFANDNNGMALFALWRPPPFSPTNRFFLFVKPRMRLPIFIRMRFCFPPSFLYSSPPSCRSLSDAQTATLRGYCLDENPINRLNHLCTT